MLLGEVVHWIGQAYHVRRKENCNDRNRHHNWIQEVACYAQRNAKGGDNE